MIKFVRNQIAEQAITNNRMFFRRKKTDELSYINHTTMMEENLLPGKGRKVMIDLPNEERIQYWARTLSCSRSDLLHAVLNVGHSYNSVEAFLSMNLRQTNGPADNGRRQ